MKNYRREGSIAWYIKRYGRLMVIVLLLGAISVAVINARSTEIEPQSEKNMKVDKAYALEEKELVNELSGFAPLDVPLDAELQKFIFDVADDYGLDGKLVLAVIGQETNYVNRVGDGGDSVGLMHVQPEWHAERMARLKIDKDELLDPYANVVVGIDYLAECIEKGGLEWGLMAYNGGPGYANEMTERGIITEYVETVIYLSEDL